MGAGRKSLPRFMIKERDMVLRNILKYLKTVPQASLFEISYHCNMEKSEAGAIIEQLKVMRKVEEVKIEMSCKGCPAAANGCGGDEKYYKYCG